MHPSSHTSILRALFLFGALVTFSSCHAATKEKPPPSITVPREPINKSHPTPIPRASPTFTPTSSITPSPTAPGVGTSPGPLLFGPIELHVQPIEVQPPKGQLHVTASGIPDRITLASDVKSVPFDLRWPKDPLNISIDLKNGSSTSKENEFQKVIDTFSQLNRECKEQLSDLNKKLADAERKEKQLQKTVDSSNKQNNTCNEKVTDLNNKLADAAKQLAQEREIHRKELEQLHKEGALSKEQYDKILRERGLPREEWWGSPLVILGFIIAAGFLGGLSLSTVEFLRERRERIQELIRLKSILSSEPAAPSSPSGSAPPGRPEKSDEELLRDDEMENEFLRYRQRQVELIGLLGRPWLPFSKWLPASLLGIVAALMVPAALRLLGMKIEVVSQNGYSLVTLCSFCFVCAMLGEPFIDGFLKYARRRLDQLAKGPTPSHLESVVTGLDRLKSVPALEKAIPLSVIYIPKDPGSQQPLTNLQQIIDALKKEGRQRLLLFKASNMIERVVHLSAIESFISNYVLHPPEANAKKPNELTISDLLAVPDLDKLTALSFALVPQAATLADAKTAMEQKSKELGNIGNCEDVFITQDGSPTLPVLGWITNDIIIENAKV